jgi:hypothetical protein
MNDDGDDACDGDDIHSFTMSHIHSIPPSTFYRSMWDVIIIAGSFRLAALASLATLARQDGLQGLDFAPYVVFISLILICCRFTRL